MDSLILPGHPERRRVAATLFYLGLSLQDVAKLDASCFGEGEVRLPGADGRALTYAEARRVLESARSTSLRDYVAVGMALTVGARQVELRRLDTKGVVRAARGAYATLRGKGGASRTVWVPEPVGDALTKLSEELEDGPVIVSRKGGPLSPAGMRRVFYRHLEAAGVDARPHDLRHTAATWLLRTGATLREAMEILGHSEVSSHEIYAAASGSWYEGAWASTHPLSQGYPVGGFVLVPGEPYDRRMSRGTERVVPVPVTPLDRLREAFTKYKEYFTNPRKMTRDFHRYAPVSPSELRERCAVQMREAGAHPFLVAMVMGVTPDHVVASEFERRGALADKGRREAIERASSGLGVAEEEVRHVG